LYQKNSYKKDQRRAHKKLDSIFSELFSKIDQGNITFQKLSEEIFIRKNDLTSLILKGALNYELHKREEIRKACPYCKRIITRHRQKTSLLQSINGKFLFCRNYFYCRNCKFGFCPSDKELQIIPRKLQFDIQWRAIELGVRMPFEEAKADLKNHYDVIFDKRILHKLVQSVSEGLTILDISKKASEIKDILLKLRNENKRRVVVVIGIDGAYVPIRPDHKKRKGKRGKGYWREAKGIRIYAIAEKRIHNILAWHQIQEADRLEKSLDMVLKANLIPTDIARICVCADGADWIWNRVRKTCPTAKMVLDYYHCSEHLHEFSDIYFTDDTKKIKWLIDAKGDLFSGNVLSLVKRLRSLKSTDNEICKKINSLADYLEERAEMTYYNSFKKGGYPIGSGGIEASNKYVCHRRMKLSGAWWKEDMANAMLILRSAYSNSSLPYVFDLYKEKQMKSYYPE
jgi:hypothetical protein